MKKVSLLILMTFIAIFFFTGCTSDKKEIPSTWPKKSEDITGDIIKATLDEDGHIIIDKSNITSEATYISYDVDTVTIGLLAVRDSNGNVKVVVNTCQSCGGSPHAYFVQIGNKIQCQNCGNLFAIDELDNLEDDGCNPIAIEEKEEKEEIIIIGTKQFDDLKSKFENWQGPKA